jgi:hypothetical protein
MSRSCSNFFRDVLFLGGTSLSTIIYIGILQSHEPRSLPAIGPIIGPSGPVPYLGVSARFQRASASLDKLRVHPYNTPWTVDHILW